MADPVSWIAIAGVILQAGELAVKTKEVSDKGAPAAAEGVKAKTRYVQCVVKNATQFDIILRQSYFDSGRYWDAPGNIPPFSQMTFTACNGDNTFMTGCSGGTQFRLSLDSTTFYDFALGWTSPYSGTFKAAVKESDSAEAGYDAVTSNGNSISSTTGYKGKDADGKETSFRLYLSAAPGQNSVYVISQVKV